MRALAAVPSVLLISACALALGDDVCNALQASSWKWTPEGVPSDICAEIHNSHRCVQRIEPYALRFAAEGVHRDEGTLRIEVPRGSDVVFEDEPSEKGGTYYLYLGHLEEGYHVVFKQLYEGSDHVLVDDVTGATSAIGGRPIFAPDGRRLATVRAGYVEEHLVVHRRTGDTWMFEWGAPLNATSTSVAWRSDDRLTVCHLHRAEDVRVTHEVVLDNGGWRWTEAVAPEEEKR